MEKRKVPKLRFPGFEGEWKSSRFSDFATFLKGKGISKSDIDPGGNIDCIRYGELYTVYDEVIDEVVSKVNGEPDDFVLSQANDVIIPASGETQVDIATASCVLRSGIALSGDLNIIRTSNNGVYISYYLNNPLKLKIASLAQGNSVVHLYPAQLSGLLIRLPEVSEQQKIACFLTAVDKKLIHLKTQKAQLKAYKKGMQQQLFSQQVRFKQDDGSDFPEWEEKELGQLLEYEQPTKYLVHSTEYDDAFETPVLTAGKTFILGYTNETFGIYDGILPVILFDDFTTSTQFVTFPFKAKSSAMKLLTASTDNNTKFVYEGMRNIQFETGGHGRHWISIFSKLTIQCPSLAEQTKIAHFLSAIDEKIALCDTQLKKTEQWKKGLLQQLFV